MRVASPPALCRSAATYQQTELIQNRRRNKRLCQKNTSIGFISGTTERGNQYSSAYSGIFGGDPWKMPPFDSRFLFLMPRALHMKREREVPTVIRSFNEIHGAFSPMILIRLSWPRLLADRADQTWVPTLLVRRVITAKLEWPSADIHTLQAAGRIEDFAGQKLISQA
jgi:hypothetical protein